MAEDVYGATGSRALGGRSLGDHSRRDEGRSGRDGSYRITILYTSTFVTLCLWPVIEIARWIW